MFFSRNKIKEANPIFVQEFEKLIWTISQFSSLSSIHPFKVRIQGRHPVTGGTSVVYMKGTVQTARELKEILQALAFNQPHPILEDFIVRAKAKVVDAYACEISVSGRDRDGDSLDYEMKLDNQNDFMHILECGLFSLEAPEHVKYKLLGDCNE